MKMPNKVKELFDSQVLVAVGTASKDGMPNVACIFWKKIVDDETIILIDNFMKATKANVKENGQICVSFWDSEAEVSYKVKGIATYHADGPVYEEGKAFIQSKNPGRVPRGVVEVKVEEVFDNTPGPNAGNKIEA
jgi:predicted pyridoxine 5'-phosphate oxidase superfamily flavin-nucleotide-binding protein